MKKLKQHLVRLLQMLMALGIMWLLSFLPVELLNSIGIVSLILALLLFGVLCVIYFKKTRHIACILMVLMIGLPTLARTLEDCDEYDNSSVDEGNFCRYNVLIDEVGGDICGSMKSFDPRKVKTGNDATELREQVNIADKIVQSYNELNETYQNKLNGSCKVLTAEDNNKSQSERLKILNGNNSPLCCAWAMQSKFQLYAAQNGERQVETVPMMLADSKMQCWPCEVVYLLVTLANTMTYRSAPSMCAIGLFFLKWMMVFWLVLKIGCLFINRNFDGKPYALGDFLKELLTRTCMVILVALVLSGTANQLTDKSVTNLSRIDAVREPTLLDEAYQELINPPFEFISALGIEATRALVRGENSFYGKVAQAVDLQGDVNVRVYGAAMKKTDYCTVPKGCRRSNETEKRSKDGNNVGCWMSDNPMYTEITKKNMDSSRYHLDVASQGRAISNETTRNLLCLTQLAFHGLAPISAAGSIITTHAIKNSWSLPFPLPGMIPILPQLIYGLIILISCWLLGVAVGFRLIDIMIRVAMVLMLTPIFIVAAVFPLTRDKAKTAVKFFVSAVMGFVEVAIAVGMIVPCFYHAIASGGNEDALIDAMVAPSSSHYVPDLYEQFSHGGCRFFLFITAVGWMGFKMLEKVSNFFEQILGVTNVGKIAAPKDANGNPQGSMMSAVNSTRESIGTNFDEAKKFVGDTGLDHKIANDTWAGRKYKSLKSAGSRAYGATKNGAGKVVDAMEKGTDIAGKGMKKGGSSLMKKGLELSKTGKGAIVGVPMMIGGALLKAGGWATQKAGKAWKYVVKKSGHYVEKMAREQSRLALYDFFHPNADKEDRDEYKRSLEKK